jgi:RimJ/RimL family protein N-acetyltransferase
VILETERLILREWRDSDRAIYASFTADPETRRFYPNTLTRAETGKAIDRYIRGLAHNGFGYLAVQRKSDGTFIGDVGLAPVEMPIHGNPPVELGYLLGRPYWGQGYAPEAARAWIAYAFDALGLPQVAAWTASINHPSRRVMEKAGMTRDPAGDFEHPKVPQGHPLRPHVLYRIARATGPA